MTRTAIALVVALMALAAPNALAAEAWEPVGGPIGPADPKPGGFDLKRIDGAPTVAYSHWTGTNHQIRVVRWDGSSWMPLGGAVNADPAGEASQPSLAAGPGGVPWVGWLERDADGHRQIRAARYSASKDRFVEPVGGDWPIQPRPVQNEEPQFAAAVNSQLVFVGSRAHVVFRRDGLSEYRVGIRRLAADRRSWRSVSTPPRYIPSSFTGTVIGGLLHTTYNSRLGGAPVIDRLAAAGWEPLGHLAESTSGYDEGHGGSLAEVGGVPYGSWNSWTSPTPTGHVVRRAGGTWEEVGDLGGASAGALRFVGGRLWVATSDDGQFALARLGGDGSSWEPSPPLAQYASGLTGIDGVPHVVMAGSDGRPQVARLTGIAPIGPDDNDGSASPCTKADPDLTKPVIAPPLPAEWPPSGSADDPSTRCDLIDHIPGEDPPAGDPPGGGPPGGNPPGHGGPPNPPGPPAPVAGPCGLRILGTPRADRLTGDGERNEIAGRAGADTIFGLGGDDCLSGNAGNDVLKGGAGADRLAGDSGHDRLIGGAGNDTVSGGPGNDVIDARGSGFDTIDCGPGRDRALVGDLDRVRNCERVVNVD